MTSTMIRNSGGNAALIVKSIEIASGTGLRLRYRQTVITNCAMNPAKTILLPLSLATLLLAATAHADDCENVIRIDGLFSKAQRECPFSYYGFRFQQQSQMCGEKAGDARWKKLFSEGAATFDSKAAGMGKAAFCAKLAKDFPMTVKF